MCDGSIQKWITTYANLISWRRQAFIFIFIFTFWWRWKDFSISLNKLWEIRNNHILIPIGDFLIFVLFLFVCFLFFAYCYTSSKCAIANWHIRHTSLIGWVIKSFIYSPICIQSSSLQHLGVWHYLTNTIKFENLILEPYYELVIPLSLISFYYS